MENGRFPLKGGEFIQHSGKRFPDDLRLINQQGGVGRPAVLILAVIETILQFKHFPADFRLDEEYVIIRQPEKPDMVQRVAGAFPAQPSE